MSSKIVPSDRDLWRLITGYFDGDASIAPYVQEIFLLECHIAGTGYLNLREIEPELNPPGTPPLLFRREPDNKHDKLAILILDQKRES